MDRGLHLNLESVFHDDADTPTVKAGRPDSQLWKYEGNDYAVVTYVETVHTCDSEHCSC